MTFYAHSENKRGEWHILADHLRSTAKIAESFGRNSIEREIFRYCGMIHDLGKYQNEFQDYLKYGGKRGSVPHAAFGAGFGYRQTKLDSIAFAVLGHHKGLSDLGNWKSDIKAVLNDPRLEDLISVFVLDTDCDVHSCLNVQHLNEISTKLGKEFFVRYLFSVLTDSDWLDTEEHFSPENSAYRTRRYLNIERMIEDIDNNFAKFEIDGELNILRNQARDEAVRNALGLPGFYSLNLPTGLGKTLTSFYWALKHAKKNNLRRIIIVLPYVNIIDQTADTLKRIFGEEVILEHHSSVIEEAVFDDELGLCDEKKLASENWDFPVIVTTTVQFFESLFSNRSSKCRKIHNISDAVVIFDEVQTLPQHLVLPTLEMLKQVQKMLGTSFLFCTATQPAFEKRDGFNGIESIIPLISNAKELFNKTIRVNYSVLDDFRPIENEELCKKVINLSASVLVVVNTKSQAADVYRILQQELPLEHGTVYHLSTNMCAHHRRRIIHSIRDCLQNEKNVLVVSTQLIEAGVDFDFPYVFRAIAPLESIIQAGGRCNREGRLAGKGNVVIFSPADGKIPSGIYETASCHARSLIKADSEFLYRHEAYGNYYRQMIKLFVDPDKQKINDSREDFLFETVAKSYRLIDAPNYPLFIKDYNDESMELFQQLLRYPLITRQISRKMQPYVVQVYQNFIFKYSSFIDSKTVNGVNVWIGKYDDRLGIRTDDYLVDELVI